LPSRGGGGLDKNFRAGQQAGVGQGGLLGPGVFAPGFSDRGAEAAPEVKEGAVRDTPDRIEVPMSLAGATNGMSVAPLDIVRDDLYHPRRG
jgi:hypothetical protein